MHMNQHTESSLEGQHVVVVGGSSGMGLALAQTLLTRGARVALVGRSRDKLDAARAHLAACGSPRLLQADVTDEEAVRELFDDIGPLDHLVCTAADLGGAYVMLGSLERDALDRAMQSKVVAPILLAKHAAPRLSPHGSITFTSGIAAYRPRPKGVVVATINAALEGMVRAMAVELAPLRVNAVSPGWVRTPIWRDVAGSDTEPMLAAMAQRLPVGRIGAPDDVARAMLYLMGSGYTTGTVLHIDGGHRLV
ncbi:MAG: SDR family oxidoreductase [Rhizobacter sp.]|nr:SDR family oxidoreductase [Rhizobacter sp.]